MALPTAAAIRALSLPQIDGTAVDTLIESEIATADAALADFCLFPRAAGSSPTMEATQYTFTLDGPWAGDTRILVTNHFPITAIASIKQDTSGDWTYATTESSSDYVLDGATGYVYASPGTTLVWGSGLRHIQIVATIGYNVGAHKVLTQAIGLLVAHWMALRRTPLTVAMTQGGQTMTLGERGIPQHVRELVWPYRLIGLER